jgi:hypothetical protein
MSDPNWKERRNALAGEYECDTQHSEREWDDNGYKYRDFQAGFDAGRADTIKLAEDILVRALDAIGNMDSAIRPLLTSRDIKEVTRNALGQWNKEKGEG